MTRTHVAVIGAGNVGCALAAHLTLLGIDVRLCNRSASRLGQIRSAGGITVTGAANGVALISSLTTNMAEAVRDADVVAVTVPAPRRLTMRGVGRDHNGRATDLARSGPRWRCPLFGHRDPPPRRRASGRLPAFDRVASRVDALLPGQFSKANSVLELDLQNVNAVMHPAPVVCDASWIEASGGDFLVYREGPPP